MDTRNLSSYPLLDNRPKRIALQIDPTVVGLGYSDDFSPISAVSTGSPITPIVGQLSSGSEGEDDAVKGRSKPGKEKRKRSRVTPEQLVKLERFFAADRSPTAPRRREISESLGMQERQTQIWFQNRRAKAKLIEGRNKRGNATPTDEVSSGVDTNLHVLIHEDESVVIVPCTDLSIGIWRRIVTGDHRDLLAYVSEQKRTLTWFIHSAGSAFKMDIPFDTIASLDLSMASNGSALASLTLSRAPSFYVEMAATPRADGSAMLHWKLTNDWTEGQQASAVFQHDVAGPFGQLSHMIQIIRRFIHTGAELHSPASYNPVMELPLPPMAGLTRPYEDSPMARDGHVARQLSSSPVSVSHPPHTAPAGSFSRTSFSGLSVGQGMSGFGYDEYVGGHGHSSTIPISQGLMSRSAHPMQSSFYNDPQLMSYHDQPRHSADYFQYDASSPSLLTTPFYPATSGPPGAPLG